MLSIPTRIASSSSLETSSRAAANSSSVTRSSVGSTCTPSNFASARTIASSPFARTSSSIFATPSWSSSSKIVAVEPAMIVFSSIGDRASQRRTARAPTRSDLQCECFQVLLAHRREEVGLVVEELGTAEQLERSWPGQVDDDDLLQASRPGRHEEHAVGEEDRLL